MTREQRLAEIGKIAARIELETGLPAKMLVAQWAAESQWGAKPVGKFNCFGIKRAARHSKWVTVRTHEVIHGVSRPFDLEFADYDSLEEAARDYAWLITNGSPYRTAWTLFEAARAKLITDVCAVYATSPAYGALVTKIAAQKNVADAIRAV